MHNSNVVENGVVLLRCIPFTPTQRQFDHQLAFDGVTARQPPATIGHSPAQSDPSGHALAALSFRLIFVVFLVDENVVVVDRQGVPTAAPRPASVVLAAVAVAPSGKDARPPKAGWIDSPGLGGFLLRDR